MGAVQTNLMEVLTRFLGGGSQPIGVVFPPRLDSPNLPDKGAREVSLRRFCDLLAALPFMRTMAGPAQPFTVPRDQIHINQPANVSGAPDGVRLPYLAFLTSSADESPDDSFLGPAIIDDDTADVYAPGTAVFWLGSHVEELQLEVVAASRSVRRAIAEGIKQVLRSSDDAGVLRLNLPDYFDQTAEFTLLGSQYTEDQDAVRNRRRALLRIQLYVPEVMLANAVDIQPFVTALTTTTVLVADDSAST